MDKAKSITTAFMNTVSDPAVLLSTGGSIIISEQSPVAAGINMATVLLAGSVRAVNELNKQGYQINTPAKLSFLFESKGGSQITAGGIKMLAAVDAARSIDITRPETFFNCGVMAGSGLSNLARGISFNTEKGSTNHKILDMAGITIPAIIYSFSNPEVPEILLTGYAASSLMAIDRSLRPHADYALKEPELLMCGTLIASASLSSDPYITAGSILWGAGYATQDMLKKHGGVVESFSYIKENLSSASREIKNSMLDKCLLALNFCTHQQIPDPDCPQVVHELPEIYT
jgi:hypothetical protein